MYVLNYMLESIGLIFWQYIAFLSLNYISYIGSWSVK